MDIHEDYQSNGSSYEVTKKKLSVWVLYYPVPTLIHVIYFTTIRWKFLNACNFHDLDGLKGTSPLIKLRCPITPVNMCLLMIRDGYMFTSCSQKDVVFSILLDSMLIFLKALRKGFFVIIYSLFTLLKQIAGNFLLYLIDCVIFLSVGPFHQR